MRGCNFSQNNFPPALIPGALATAACLVPAAEAVRVQADGAEGAAVVCGGAENEKADPATVVDAPWPPKDNPEISTN